MSDDQIPFALAQLPERAPWWPHSPWATWKRIRDGKMAAIRDGKRRIYVTTALLRQYLTEHVTQAVKS
ncbi:MAG TPA: hypothetical protein VHZ95_22025 [Polyangiales bacterium]|jgi:hypothetical protein|nr:hypothetical protein [Polyangiales bacterium]